jgi:predicted enzyme related to lactoylglutathione lyase/ketosteroid isomerase-like protein
MSGEVSFFSIGVGDTEQARAFYGSLFGWGFSDPPTGPGAVIDTSTVGGGIHGGDPGASPYLFFSVDDLAAASQHVRELGGEVLDDNEPEDQASTARFGRFRLCRDDQGSAFGLHQKPAEDVHAELVNVLDGWTDAIVANDSERIGSFMADDWVIVSGSGITSRADFLSFVASGDLTHSAMDRVGEARVRAYGDIAVLTTRQTNTAHHAGRRIDADEWTTDLFTRRRDGWLCVLSHITAVASP